MDSDNRPRYPGYTGGDEYKLIEDLLSGTPRKENESMKGNNGCECGDDHGNMQGNGECPMPYFPENVPLAMVYSPDHEFDDMYEPEEGLEAGTIFIRLDKPFKGRTMSGGNMR